jgi:glutamate 5-kinase
VSDDARSALTGARRVVVKVGSQVLAGAPGAFGRIAYDIARLRADGREVVLVTSGAIALGLAPLGVEERPRDVVGLQAAAAVGQSRLMWRWTQVLEAGHDLATAQVLLTHADLSDRRRYLNARAALLRLLRAGVVPIVNENDTVSIEEIKLGDNDLLAAEVAGLVDAELIVLLTSADGLMTADPRADPDAERVPVVVDLEDAKSLAGEASGLGTGGMATKLSAAEIARRHGATTVIAPGLVDGALRAVLRGEDVGTLVQAEDNPERARKRWIAHTLRPAGTLVVDEGAARALLGNASLLYAGVRDVRGDFSAGECVEIECDGRAIARGLVTLDAAEARAVAGKRTSDVTVILGGAAPDELVHRDDLAVLDP